MELLKEWTDFDNQYKKVLDAFSVWYWRNITHERGEQFGTVESMFGFAYTSSSAFAALWICNSQWHYKFIPDYVIRGLAISTDGFAVAVFESKTNDILNPTLFVPFGNVSYIPTEVKE